MCPGASPGRHEVTNMAKTRIGGTKITDYYVGTVSDEDWRSDWCGSFPEITVPRGFTLDRAYRYGISGKDNELNERTNAQLLAALGSFQKDDPFVPITIDSDEEAEHSGLPTIDRVELSVGKILQPKQSCWVGKITYVDSIVDHRIHQ